MPVKEPDHRLMVALAYRFADSRLLASALTHRSYSNERPDHDVPCNERLEFLGDAVLALVVSDELYRRRPDLPEGELTRMRAGIVNRHALATVARRLDLGSALLLGRGEEKSGGRDKDNLLADALEALFAAVYCDGGLAAAQEVLLPLLAEAIDAALAEGSDNDFKTALQELLQRQRRALPEYRLREVSGPDHDRCFVVEAVIEEVIWGAGEGRSKKDAEQRAARAALARLAGS